MTYEIAEDHYGNDYPEEIESDDEHVAFDRLDTPSDDEVINNDTIAWSDASTESDAS